MSSYDKNKKQNILTSCSDIKLIIISAYCTYSNEVTSLYECSRRRSGGNKKDNRWERRNINRKEKWTTRILNHCTWVQSHRSPLSRPASLKNSAMISVWLSQKCSCIVYMPITLCHRHSARKVTPYPWECYALPSKYFKTRSLSRRLCIELLNETWKMMTVSQRPPTIAPLFFSIQIRTSEKGRQIQVNKGGVMWQGRSIYRPGEVLAQRGSTPGLHVAVLTSHSFVVKQLIYYKEYLVEIAWAVCFSSEVGRFSKLRH